MKIGLFLNGFGGMNAKNGCSGLMVWK